MNQPNVVFIVLDSLRKDRLSVYSSDIDFTGNLEEFSREADVYRDAVANAPWTLPSHASMFTGLYPWEHGATQRNLDLDVEKDTLAEMFLEEGYRTGCISTNVWLSDNFGLTDGFELVDNLGSTGLSSLMSRVRRRLDRWLSSPGNERVKRSLTRVGNRIFHYWLGGSQTEQAIEKGIEFLESEGEPSFLFLNLMDVHEPYFPPEEYREKHGAPEPGKVCQDPSDFYAGRRNADFDSIGRIYDASMDYLDDQLGRFFDRLREGGSWEDTVIVVTSDHGQLLGEDGMYGHQYSVAEPLVSVPLMVKHPESGGEVGDQVELRELYRILPSHAGLEEDHGAGTEYALGGYEFPDLQRPRIPRKRWDEFYRRHRFARSKRGKAVRTESEGGDTTTSYQSFDGELEEHEKEDLEERLDSIGTGEDEQGEQLDGKDEEIQRKLKDLGYG